MPRRSKASIPKRQARKEPRIPMTLNDVGSDMRFVPRKSRPASKPSSYGSMAQNAPLPAIQRAKKRPLGGKYTN